MNICDRINKLRAEKGWSVNNLAMEAGLTQSTLSSILTRNASPRVSTIQSICKAFDITLAQFFCEDEGFEVLSREEKQLLSLFRLYSKEKKQHLISLLEK